MENGKWAAKHELLFWPKARACSYLHGPVSHTYPQLYLVSKYIFHQNSSLARLRRRWCLLAPGCVCVCVASLAEIAMTANQLCSNRSGFLSYFPVWPKWISTFCWDRFYTKVDRKVISICITSPQLTWPFWFG